MKTGKPRPKMPGGLPARQSIFSRNSKVVQAIREGGVRRQGDDVNTSTGGKSTVVTKEEQKRGAKD